MPEDAASKSVIPILTDVVDEATAGTETATYRDTETLIAELQTQLSASAFALTEQILRSAFAEIEAALHEQISARLRTELPELIDRVLRQRLGDDEDS